MKIIDFSVKNWQFTIVVFFMMVAVGLSSWFSIPRGEDPAFPIPGYQVIAIYPGATPSDLEELVVDPIEERLGELQQLKEIRTRIEDGMAFLWVEFETSADANRKKEEVQREINALRPDLPRDLQRLTVEQGGSQRVSIVQIALVSELAPYHQLEQYAEQLEERIEFVPGVLAAEAQAFPERQVSVSLDLQRLAELRIPASQVLQAIGSEDANIPGGSVALGSRKLSVKSSGNYGSLEEVRNTVVAGARGQIVRLGDVGTVAWGYADPGYMARYNGKRAVFVSAQQKQEFNIGVVRDGIYNEIDRFEKTLPPGIKLERGFDQARNVSKRLTRLGEDFLIAIGLVLLTLLPLGPRAAVIVMISIPLSLAMGVALLYLTGFSVNQLSIVGAVIALGLLVDDSIVVVENIARHLRAGFSRRDAAIMGTRQIAVAVLGCTATLILAFVPLLFLPGLPGRYIRSLPITVVYTVLASLLVSMTIIPWLASLLLKETKDEHGNIFLRGFNRAIAATYAPLLHRALAAPRRTLALALVLFVGSLALVPVVGFSLFPKAGTPQFLIDIETPSGAALAETDRAARFTEQVLARHPEVKTVFTNVGGGNPQVYYNVFPAGEQANIGQLFVLLEHYDPKRSPALFDTLRAQLGAYPGARIQVREFENGPPIDAPVAIRIFGDNLDTLRALSLAVERVMTATPGTQYVENPLRIGRTDLKVAIDREKAGMLGIPTIEIDRTLRLGIAGMSAGHLRDAQGDEYPVQVRLPTQGAPGLEALDHIHLASFTGAQVPLRQVADVRLAASPSVIQHQDRQRVVTVTSYVRSGFNTDRVTRDVLARLDEIKTPAGYELVAAGEIESRQKSFGGIGSAVIVAMFSILAVLVLEFRTFRSTLIVASVIPLGMVGGITALLLSGYTLSFMSMIGFVALIGIEIKTSILLVDFTNQLRAQGMALDDAIQHAGEVRFVPIVLTSLTAIGGLLPLALQGSALYSPLAWVIIGGLVSSTMLARLVTPVMYKLLAPGIVVA